MSNLKFMLKLFMLKLVRVIRFTPKNDYAFFQNSLYRESNTDKSHT